MDLVALADAGGWTVVVVMIAFIGVGVVKGWWVPGFVYTREVARGDTATTQVERNTQAINDLVAELRARSVPAEAAPSGPA